MCLCGFFLINFMNFMGFSSWVRSEFNPWHFCLGEAVQTAVLNLNEERSSIWNLKLQKLEQHVGNPVIPKSYPIFFRCCQGSAALGCGFVWCF